MRDAGSLAAFRRWRPLAGDLAGDIHPDRWLGLGVSPGAALRLASCPRSRRSLSARLDWLFPGAGRGGFETPADDDEAAGWALLSGSAIWGVGMRLGAARFRLEIARLVRRDEVADLKRAIGEDAYRFALRQATLLCPRGALDEGGEPASGALAERVAEAGGLGLGCWLARLPSGLALRALLKLPPVCDQAAVKASDWPDGRQAAWLAVLRRLFRLAA